jgi:hypothetical protein
LLAFGAVACCFGFGFAFAGGFGWADAIFAAIRGGALWCGPGVQPLKRSAVAPAQAAAIAMATIVAPRESRSSTATGSSTGSGCDGATGSVTAPALGFGFVLDFAIRGRSSG